MSETLDSQLPLCGTRAQLDGLHASLYVRSGPAQDLLVPKATHPAPLMGKERRDCNPRGSAEESGRLDCLGQSSPSLSSLFLLFRSVPFFLSLTESFLQFRESLTV